MSNPRRLSALQLLVPCAVLLFACDKDKAGDETTLAGKIMVDEDGTRTVEYAACEIVTVDKSGKLVVKSKEGQEVVVDETGKIVKADRDFRLVSSEYGEKVKVYVASTKKLVSEDVYLGKTEVDDDDGKDEVVDDDHDDDDNDGAKIAICHVPPGNPDNAHTLQVGRSAVSAHLKHGDYEGACDGRDLPAKHGGKGQDDDHGKGNDKRKSGKGNKGSD
jgi:hypothetical protein